MSSTAVPIAMARPFVTAGWLGGNRLTITPASAAQTAASTIAANPVKGKVVPRVVALRAAIPPSASAAPARPLACRLSSPWARARNSVKRGTAAITSEATPTGMCTMAQNVRALATPSRTPNSAVPTRADPLGRGSLRPATKSRKSIEATAKRIPAPKKGGSS